YVERYAALAREVDAHVEDDAVTPYKMAKPARLDAAQVGAKRLAASGIDTSLAEKLATFVTDAPDVDVIHMRPFDIADRWERDRIEVLRAFLHSVQAGLTELRWSIICPSCRTASEEVSALEEITLQGHCQMCDISFDLDLDKSVEATFLPHEAVRPVVTQQFCIGGPSRVPHVIAQANLDPQDTHVFTAPAEIGRYRIFVRGGAVASLEVATDAATETAATVRDSAVEPSELRVAPTGKITVKNASSEGRHAKLERIGYASAAATAHVVSTLPEFRRFFSKDLLKRETPLKVSHVAILFSDLVGSTALYTHVGDATAFRIVDDHFDLLREIVGRHDGVVVKTMGDAILAAFTDEAKATEAAADSLIAFEDFRKKREHGDRIGIKLGLYAGACYVVSANGVLDYFGQVVNVASRVQHLAGSGEILLPQEVFDALDPSLRDRLVVTEKLAATVKGVANPIPLVRTRLSERLHQEAGEISPSTSSRSDAEAPQPRS
ncbi:MAG: adenylate/guanylate cyclase domain-containing protein, partial [Polyangiaceae bacterium]